MRPLTSALILEKQNFRTQVLEAVKPLPIRIVLDQGAFGAWHMVQDQLERLQPDVILMDLADQADESFFAIRQVRTLTRPPSVVVFHDNNDAQLILNAMRAGAAEFLTLPLERGVLSAALERISTLLPAGQTVKETRGRLIGFLSAKGGAGATTLICNIASFLRVATGKQVLLADLDMETGNVAFAMRATSQYSILEACRNISRLDLHYWKGLVSNGMPGLNILTAPADLQGVEPPQGVEIRQVLRFARTVHDFTMVDLPSRLNRMTLAVLEDVDQVFLITTADLPALHLANRTLRGLSDAGVPLGRVALLVNRISRRDQVTPEDIARNLNLPVYWSFPDDFDAATEFYVKGSALQPQSDLGKAIRQFVHKIAPAEPAAAVQRKKSFWG